MVPCLQEFERETAIVSGYLRVLSELCGRF